VNQAQRDSTNDGIEAGAVAAAGQNANVQGRRIRHGDAMVESRAPHNGWLAWPASAVQRGCRRALNAHQKRWLAKRTASLQARESIMVGLKPVQCAKAMGRDALLNWILMRQYCTNRLLCWTVPCRKYGLSHCFVEPSCFGWDCGLCSICIHRPCGARLFGQDAFACCWLWKRVGQIKKHLMMAH